MKLIVSMTTQEHPSRKLVAALKKGATQDQQRLQGCYVITDMHIVIAYASTMPDLVNGICLGAGPAWPGTVQQ